MRSHLARTAYRRVLASHGQVIQPRRYLSSYALPTRETRLFRPRTIIRRPSRRTFFGLFSKAPRELRAPELEPGYIALLQFASYKNNNFRLPPREELVKGFHDFFEYKAKAYTRKINSTQASFALRLLRHLRDTETLSDQQQELTLLDFRTARDVALREANGTTDDHLELSRELFADIQRSQASEAGTDHEASTDDFRKYITALTQYGASLEAAEQLEKFLQASPPENSGMKELWISVLRGLAAEGKEKELKQTALSLEGKGIRFNPAAHEIMTAFFAKRNNIVETKRWFDRPIHDGQLPTPKTYYEIMRFAMRNDHQPWAQPIFQQIMETNSGKEIWDVALQWLVLGMNKGSEDIRDAIIKMGKQSEPRAILPDTATVNGLIRAAIDRKDPYLAERFVHLGTQLQIPSDTETHILQMDYRLEAKDFSGAHAIYKELELTQAENNEDLPVINKYIRALCAVEDADIDRVLEITAAVEERSVPLEPETTVSLCTTLLKSDKQYDVIDTLSLHTVQYSFEERELVRTAFVQYCLDQTNSTARVWDAYSLLRQFFPETEPPERVQLMEAFFKRKRPDMACHIFGHMRAHKNTSQRPTADIYVKCLEGLWRHPDDESLQMVHNMLKMDSTIQMTTKLYNALMLAYAGCDRPTAAFDFWTNITNSAEGPSYNSLAIAFRVCETLPFGDRKARQIWQKLQRMDLDIPPVVYGSYVAAIASEGHMEEVKKLLGGMEASIGCSPNIPTQVATEPFVHTNCKLT
ncbi:hypothetical protein GQ53DRAFT_103750 [Thozetella sp. PMI_491]|nr:hypothetical protein GQ53DRAFT_103750 [Thozetella sp. PMI_491]